jgi:hypothetical protein
MCAIKRWLIPEREVNPKVVEFSIEVVLTDILLGRHCYTVLPEEYPYSLPNLYDLVVLGWNMRTRSLPAMA